MEDIATDDDLLSDMLLDSLEFEPKIATHKMNQAYRSPRYKTQQIIDIVRQRIVIDGDLQGALDALCNVDVIKKHVAIKSSRQRHEFQIHARRYLETYMPDAGVEFALTTRYKRASRLQQPESSRVAQELHAAATAAAVGAAAAAASKAGESVQVASAVARGKMRAEAGELLGTSMADLCVVATKPFKAGDLIIMCKGGVKDLTKSEDEALREEAAVDRERRKEEQYTGVLGPGRDFSVIRSARKGCSQLLLGPARFVNHDCDPNCEFHRLGQSQMVFRCLRDVGLNEEITTFYGENYFEVGNAECMCQTCEVRGNGAFSKNVVPTTSSTTTDTETASISNGASSEDSAGKAARRHSARKVRTPPPTAAKAEPTTIRIERSNGKVIEKTFSHHVSGREFDEQSISHIGPRCTCLTCGSLFWAPEAWWLPDECRRCERHFKIYQGDWPIRVPTEPKWSAIYRDRRARREQAEVDRRRRLLEAASPGVSGASDTDTPVKLSPLRTTEEEDDAVTARTYNGKGKRSRLASVSNGNASRKKKRVIPDEEQDDDDDESMEEVEKSIGTVTHDSRQRQQASQSKTTSTHTALYNSASDDDDLSDLTSVSANDVTLSRSASAASSNSDDRPCGPKMLGKHAKTETLAMFWGAETSNKRVRKPRLNGLESLSDTVKVAHKHRRTASDVSASSHPHFRERGETVRSPSGPQLSSSQSQPLPFHSREGFGLPPRGKAEDELERTTSEEKTAPVRPHGPLQHSTSDVSVDLTSRFSGGSGSAPPSSEGTAFLPLATQGPERTSVKNLAMAWGAGVEEGGRGSRRRTPRETGTPTALASSSTSSPRPVKDEGSATPPGRLGKEPSPMRRTSVAEYPREEEQVLTTSTSSVPFASRPSDMIGAAPQFASRSAAPLLSAYAGTDSSPPGSDRSVSPSSSATGSSLQARNASPLAGLPPPAVTFAPRQGAVPGQPIRRNLRWGSGKVSLSRPLSVGAGSPLAGPVASSSSPTASASLTGGLGAPIATTSAGKVVPNAATPSSAAGVEVGNAPQQGVKREQLAVAPSAHSNGVHVSPPMAVVRHAEEAVALKRENDGERLPRKSEEDGSASLMQPMTSSTTTPTTT